MAPQTIGKRLPTAEREKRARAEDIVSKVSKSDIPRSRRTDNRKKTGSAEEQKRETWIEIFASRR